MTYLSTEKHSRDNQRNFDFIHKCQLGTVKEVYDVLFNKPVYVDDMATQNLDINIQDGFSAACKSGNLKIVKELLFPSTSVGMLSEGLTSPATLNRCDSIGLDGLSAAALGGQLTVIKYLLNKENINSYFNIESSIHKSFEFAYMGGNLEVVDYFLTNAKTKKYIDINQKDKYGYDSFLISCNQGNLDVVKYLLGSDKIKTHADINSVNYENENCAVLISKKIQQKQFQIDAENKERELTKKTIITSSYESQHEETLIYLLKNKNLLISDSAKENIFNNLKNCPDILHATQALLKTKTSSAKRLTI
jgi:ankyrin repeat protein